MYISTRRGFILGASSVAVSAIFLNKAHSQEKTPIIWGPPAGPSIIAAYAVKTGMLNDIIPECQFKVWTSPDQIRAGFASGSTTMAILPSYSGANLYNKGLGVRLANILTDGLIYIIAPQASNIKTLSDLVGKKLAVPFKNDMPDFVIQTILKANNISPTAVDIHYMGSIPEAMPLLMMGKVDATVMVEPACSAIISMSAATPKKIERVLDVQQLWKKVANTDVIPQAGLFVGKGFEGDAGRAKIEAMNKVFSAALDEIKQDPEKAAEKIASVLDFPSHLVASSIAYSHLVIHNSKEVKPSLEGFFNILLQQNSAILGGKLPDNGFYA